MLLDSLIFFPDPNVPAPPPGVEERWIVTEDGIRLHAWYATPTDPVATLVWSHGNGGNIAGRVEVLLALATAGVAVLAYDYRGYGRAPGGRASAAYTSTRSRRTTASGAAASSPSVSWRFRRVARRRGIDLARDPAALRRRRGGIDLHTAR